MFYESLSSQVSTLVFLIMKTKKGYYHEKSINYKYIILEFLVTLTWDRKNKLQHSRREAQLQKRTKVNIQQPGGVARARS